MHRLNGQSSQNQNTVAALRYHESTKHSEESLRANVHFLDWGNKPLPFKIYRGVELSESGLSHVIHWGTIQFTACVANTGDLWCERGSDYEGKEKGRQSLTPLWCYQENRILWKKENSGGRGRSECAILTRSQDCQCAAER